MYEKLVVHAIQHKKHKGFQLRYRMYANQKERDLTFETMQKQSHKSIESMEKVTLTITVETVIEQQSLEM